MENQKVNKELTETRTRAIGNIGRFLLLLLSIALVVVNFYLITYCKIASNLLFTGLLILEYFLITFVFVCLTAFIKKGIRNVNSFDDGGVLSCFLGGLLCVTMMLLLCLFLGLGLTLAQAGATAKDWLSIIIFILIVSMLCGIAGFFEEIDRYRKYHKA